MPVNRPQGSLASLFSRTVALVQPLQQTGFDLAVKIKPSRKTNVVYLEDLSFFVWRKLLTTQGLGRRQSSDSNLS